MTPWILVALSGIAGAFLAAREHLQPSQLFLYGLWGAGGAAVLLLAGIQLWRAVGPGRVPATKKDLIAEAARRGIRAEAGGYLRSLYQGAGSSALGGIMSEAEVCIRGLRTAGDPAKRLAGDLLAESSLTMHRLIDPVLATQACDTDAQFHAFLTAWGDIFSQYQRVVSHVARAHDVLGPLPVEQRGNWYLSWRRADAEFIASLKRIQHMEGCESLLTTFRQVGWGEDARPPIRTQ